MTGRKPAWSAAEDAILRSHASEGTVGIRRALRGARTLSAIRARGLVLGVVLAKSETARRRANDPSGLPTALASALALVTERGPSTASEIGALRHALLRLRALGHVESRRVKTDWARGGVELFFVPGSPEAAIGAAIERLRRRKAIRYQPTPKAAAFPYPRSA